MNIEKIKEWALENWQVVLMALIILFSVTKIATYKPGECKEFDLVDKIEKSGVHNKYIIYYSDGRIEDSCSIPNCIKLNK